MIKKVLIANRGAIAVRICRTLKTLGIQSVAIYSEADADSLHIKTADEAYSLGDGNAQDTYLDQQKILELCTSHQVDAIHPGYGFLSENASFSRRCESAGIIFLGPQAEQMEIFGLKHTAREIAQKNQIPLLPGSDLLRDSQQAIDIANAIGYPVMLKSTAGGGGIGMQLCYNDSELSDAFDSVKRLSSNNFDNDNVFLEKFVESARHIEVQVFGDGQGNAIALGERDCSSQRRNQKVIEETPAPNLSDTVRTRLHQLAKTLLASVNYRSAGTVEFIYDQQTEDFYFLEVNTRLQVEHGVTEQIYNVDIVEWMIQLGANTLPSLEVLESDLSANGHAIQIRLYAENPYKNFQPSAGLLSEVNFPHADGKHLRIDHWIEAGVEVSPFFDPMLAKIICWAKDRKTAISDLHTALAKTSIYGIETNKHYTQAILRHNEFVQGTISTRTLNSFQCDSHSVDVLAPGTLTTLQDFPGRTGYWHIGVPPSGGFDSVALRLANQLVNNDANAAALEITLNGPTLQFNCDTTIAITGAEFNATLDGNTCPMWQTLPIQAGQVLTIASTSKAGARCYLAIAGGWQCPDYLGSKSTFTLGQFGGHVGRALRTGDVLHCLPQDMEIADNHIAFEQRPHYTDHWQLRVIYGPHGAPDFFTQEDIDTFFESTWEVHYNSSRTGVRLIGPKPQWARTDGGEAGMHPSNIHDNAYAIGTIDFTGDMPVILGPDGPSLGGFVCPATVIQADLWKLGQLKVGDNIQFIPISIDDAVALEQQQLHDISRKQFFEKDINVSRYDSPIIKTLSGNTDNHKTGIDVVYRPSGDHYLLVEYGELVLDIELRFRVHALMLWLENKKQADNLNGILELTPGIRSLQIHYNSQSISLNELLSLLEAAEQELGDCKNREIPARIIHLPLSWDDEACKLAVEKYQQSVRKDAPWYPSNLEFIRRINGLQSIDEVKRIVFDANYLVMGLGDVYLGAPVATPLDPRHRLVTTKYNPARIWTAENSVGIGGSYLCIYGMEGPGGYQFIGRTLQMWNRYRTTDVFDQPWLLRFFDQIRFYEVNHDELQTIRQQFPKGDYPLKIEETIFSLKDYHQYLEDHQTSINKFTQARQKAFDDELQRWVDSGQIHFETEKETCIAAEEQMFHENESAIESHVAGNIWQVSVKENQAVNIGDVVMILESMKMEIEIIATTSGTVRKIIVQEGQQVSAGQALLIVENKEQ